MLQVVPLGHNLPDADGDSEQRTGEKRRKYLRPSLPGDTSEVADARISSSCSHATRVQEKPGNTIYQAPWEKIEPDLMGDIQDETFLRCEGILSNRPKISVAGHRLDLESQRQVYERLMLYRIRAHKLFKRESFDEEALQKELRTSLQQYVSILELQFHVTRHIRALEKDEARTVFDNRIRALEKDQDRTVIDEDEDRTVIDWYFHTRYSTFAELDDYQRLILRNIIINGYEYCNWKKYCSQCTTYEMDKEYVEFFEVLSSKLKWLKCFAGYPDLSIEWEQMFDKGLRQALVIASGYPKLTLALAYNAYMEHNLILRSDYLFREELDRLFFEIWLRVGKTTTTFADALEEIYRKKLVPRHERLMEDWLEEDSWSTLDEDYYSCVQGISGDASPEDAKAFIILAVSKSHKRKDMLHDYMARKIKIAKRIGLVK